MKEYLPYIVSVVTALIAFWGSLLVNRKNNKAEIKKLELEHKQIMERNKQEQDARIEQLEKEYALKMGTQLVSSFTDRTLDAVYSSSSVKEQINKQALRSFTAKQSRRRGTKK